MDGGRNSKEPIFSWPSSSTSTTLRFKYRIKIVILLQLFHGDAVLLRHLFKLLRREFRVDLPAQTRAPDVGGNPVRHRANGEHGIHRSELLFAAFVQNVRIN